MHSFGIFRDAGETCYPIVWSNTYWQFSITSVDSTLPEGQYRFTADNKLVHGVLGYNYWTPTVEFSGASSPTSDSIIHIIIPLSQSVL